MHSKTKNTSTIILFFRMKTLMDFAPVIQQKKPRKGLSY